MPEKLNGELVYTQAELIETLGVSRQTMWRWRTEGAIPAGRRLRGGGVIFSLDEVREIEQFANRVIEDSAAPDGQLRFEAIQAGAGR